MRLLRAIIIRAAIDYDGNCRDEDFTENMVHHILSARNFLQELCLLDRVDDILELARRV
jgi:hypothetical protein